MSPGWSQSIIEPVICPSYTRVGWRPTAWREVQLWEFGAHHVLAAVIPAGGSAGGRLRGMPRSHIALATTLPGNGSAIATSAPRSSKFIACCKRQRRHDRRRRLR